MENPPNFLQSLFLAMTLVAWSLDGFAANWLEAIFSAFINSVHCEVRTNMLKNSSMEKIASIKHK